MVETNAECADDADAGGQGSDRCGVNRDRGITQDPVLTHGRFGERLLPAVPPVDHILSGNPLFEVGRQTAGGEDLKYCHTRAFHRLQNDLAGHCRLVTRVGL